MRFVYVVRGAERKNKQLDDILLIQVISLRIFQKCN